MRRSRVRAVVLLAAAMITIMAGANLGGRSASAAQAGWANFSAITGSTQDYAFTMQQPANGFPLAEVTSTAYTASTASGASAFLPPQTPVTARYGCARDEPHAGVQRE